MALGTVCGGALFAHTIHVFLISLHSPKHCNTCNPSPDYHHGVPKDWKVWCTIISLALSVLLTASECWNVILRSQHSSQQARDHLVSCIHVHPSCSPQFVLYHNAGGLHLEFTGYRLLCLFVNTAR